MHGVVFRPGIFDGAGESEHVLAVDLVIRGRCGGEPFHALIDRLFGVAMNKFAGIGIGGIAADVFEAPAEWLDTAIVVGGPAAVLVTSDFVFEPMHARSRPLVVYSRKVEEKNANWNLAKPLREQQERRSRKSQHEKALGMRHGAGQALLRRCGRYGRVLSVAQCGRLNRGHRLLLSVWH